MTPRRLPDMSSEPPPWRPHLPAVGVWEQEFPIVRGAVHYLVRFEWDARIRLTEWAVALLREDREGRRRRVAVFDTCHGKGVHVHHYDRSANEFHQELLWDVSSHEELAESLDRVVDLVREQWERFERRSTRGR